jgi:ribonucleotide reductase alpha subunit
MLQNPRTPEAKRNRDVHFAVMTNSFFAKKARDGGKIFSFNCFTAPDLHAALFSGDIKNFEILYDKYEKNDSFVKEYVDARELCLSMLTQFEEVSTLYHFNIEEANRHTSFQEPIHSSNLCVAPETMLLTDKGLHRIQSLAGKIVNVWNGKQWSTVPVVKTGVNQKLLTVMFSDGKHISCTPYHKFYIVKLSGEIEVRAAQLKVGDVTVGFKLPDGKISGLIRVTSITDNGRLDDTYCLNEPIEHKVVFNGILTGNCLEITEPDAPYAGVKDLYRTEDYGQVTIKTSDNNIHKLTYNLRINVVGRGVTFAGSLRHGEVFSTLEDDPLKNVTVSELISKEIPGEVALCSLAATVLTNIHTDEQYAKTAKLALRMIDRCIHLSDYALPHIGFTAKSRLNAGVGHIGLATVLARKGLKYGTLEGRNEIHHISERHLYFMTLAALELGEELGNAPWIHKTKWPNGWLPIDSYNKNVDELVTVGLEYDWETLRSRIIKNGGIRFSSLVALMPTESSSKASGAPNGPYPIRALTLKKSDENNVLDWVATDSDLLADAYTIGYDVEGTDLIKDYAVMQKLTDHSISADTYKDRSVDVMLSDRQIMTEYLTMMRYGVKSKYYSNTLTNSADGSGEKKEVNVEENCGDSCKL